MRFFVPGLPRPGGSKKAFVSHKTGKVVVMDDCKGNADWRACVARAGSFAMGNSGAFSMAPMDCPLSVSFAFRVPRPKGHYGSGRNTGIVKQAAPRWPASKPDVTKLVRAAEDALTGICWRDDAQIVEQFATKLYVDGINSMPGVAIEIKAMESDHAIATS